MVVEGIIIIDEIQEAPRGLDSLKYFCEDAKEYHVAVAGSLLGVTHRPRESYPVGKVDILRLYPMTFEEFLWAKGEELLAEKMAKCEWDLLSGLNTKLEELLRQYYFVGGMPEAVLYYTQKGDVTKVRTIQNAIIATYSNDFAKHAGRETERIRMVWNSIPAQLAKENKKFVYGAIKKGGRAREFESAIQWLVEAGLVNKIHRVKEPTLPLKFYEDFDSFKLYLLDVGLLGALSDTSPVLMFTSNSVFQEYKGAFTENYVLQQLVALENSPVYYYNKERSTLEIDFLKQTMDNVIPIEVKAEGNVRSKSLSQFVRVEFPAKNMHGIRFSMKDYEKQDWMENIPLYGVCGYLKN